MEVEEPRGVVIGVAFGYVEFYVRALDGLLLCGVCGSVCDGYGQFCQFQ